MSEVQGIGSVTSPEARVSYLTMWEFPWGVVEVISFPGYGLDLNFRSEPLFSSSESHDRVGFSWGNLGIPSAERIGSYLYAMQGERHFGVVPNVTDDRDSFLKSFKAEIDQAASLDDGIPQSIEKILADPRILVEQSPPQGRSVYDIFQGLGSDSVGTTLGVLMVGGELSPWLVLSIPAGIFLMRVTKDSAAAFGQVASKWIRKLEPKNSAEEEVE